MCLVSPGRWALSSEDTQQQQQQQPSLEADYEGHVDWVNDLALLGDALVSCSNDRTLRVWSASKEGKEGA